jgi:hypothetical protein
MGTVGMVGQWLVDREERGLLCRVIRLELPSPMLLFCWESWKVVSIGSNERIMVKKNDVKLGLSKV